MAAIVLNSFGGMVPRYGAQNIPNDAAVDAENALLLSGELRGLKERAPAVDLRGLSYVVQRIYRVIDDNGEFDWVPFADKTVDFVKGPLINDGLDRYYATSENDVPRSNTRRRWVAHAAETPNNDPYRLGTPPPAVAPSLTPSGGGGPVVDRAYVYTYVSAYDVDGIDSPPVEEGQPSPAAIASGNDDGTWDVSGILDPDPVQADGRNITTKRLYRTVTSNNGVAEYHFVADLPVGDGDTYADNNATADVSLNTILPSEDWAEPPEDLRGIIAHPNGFLVGFEGRDLYFSEPYRPHAWPVKYRLSTQDQIIGLGLFGTTVVVCTAGFPYTINGIRPDALSFTKAQTPDPCVSTRRGIVSMPFGVYYPSDNGLVLVSPAGFQVATQGVMTIDEWRKDYAPSLLEAARWQSRYVGFYSNKDGLMFAPDEERSAFVELAGNAWDHDFIQEDLFSSDTYIVKDNFVSFWNPYYGIPVVYRWRSKEFVVPKPVNFGAFKCEYDLLFTVDQRIIDGLVADNDNRFQYPLNPLNFAEVDGVRQVESLPSFTPPAPGTQNSQPMHKSPLFSAESNLLEASLKVKIYADGQLVHQVRVEDQEMYRLPAGFKATRWWVEFEGNVNLKSFKMTETGKELLTV